MLPIIRVLTATAALCSGLILVGCSTSESGSTAGSGSAASNAPSTSVSRNSAIDDTYFPVAVGNTWVYRLDLTDEPKGPVIETVTVIEVTPASGSTKVMMKTSGHYPSGAYPDYSRNREYIFYPDGSLTPPNISGPDTTVVLKSKPMKWPTPSQLGAKTAVTGTVELDLTSSTDRTPAPTLYTTKFRVVGAGVSTVAVPAGSYQVTALTEELATTTKNLTIPLKRMTTYYFAKGVGMVKSFVPHTSSGSVGDETTVLLSFTKG